MTSGGRPRPRMLLTSANVAAAIVFAMACAAPVVPPAPHASTPAAPGAPLASMRPPATVADTPAPGVAPIEGARLLAPQPRDMAPGASAEQVAALARSNGLFAVDLYRTLARGGDGNLVVGPHSISSSLAMLYVGSAGSTADAMREVMRFAAPPAQIGPSINALDLALVARNDPGKVDLRLANQGFAAPGLGFVDEYLATLARDFGAPMAELDFGQSERATEVINDWAADRTNGRIDGLFPPGVLNANTVLVLANAVAMDAAWKYEFDPAATTTASFETADGRTVYVPTMHFELTLPLAWSDRYAAVELPYGAGDLSMVLILPDDFDAFERRLSLEGLQDIFDAIEENGIHLSLPKFSFKSHTELDAALQKLGLADLYGGADLSRMLLGGGYFLQTVQHEAFIEVDEEGTEAHAATGTAVAASHGPTITFDRPFLFVIRDRPTGAILFMGRVTDPSATS